MNFTSIQQQLTEALGWTLLHSLWQGLVIAAILALTIRFIKNKSPQLIYQLCCLSLLGLGSWMAFTFLNHFHWPVPEANAAAPFEGNDGEVLNIVNAANWQESTELFFQSFIQSYADVLVLLWLFGVVLFGLKWVISLYYTYSLKNRHVSVVPNAWQSRVDHFSKKLKIKKAITILESTKIKVPMVIGCLKPVILIPTAVFSGFSPEQIETIIVHELAHVKSNDFLVGLILSAMEVLLFYHPMYWWISGIITEEREKRCDDIVVEQCGNPLGYARTLFTIAEQKQQRSLALSAQGKKHQLLERIQRICISKNNNMNTNNNKMGLALGLLFLMAIMAVAQVPTETKLAIINPVKESLVEPVQIALLPESIEEEPVSEIALLNDEVEKATLEPLTLASSKNESLQSVQIRLNKGQGLLQGNSIRLLTPLDTVPLTSADKKSIILITKLDKEGNLAGMEKHPDGSVNKFFIKDGEGHIFLNGKRLSKGNHKLVLPNATQISIRGNVTIVDEDEEFGSIEERSETDEAEITEYNEDLEAYEEEIKEYEETLAIDLERQSEKELITEKRAYQRALKQERELAEHREYAGVRKLEMARELEERQRNLQSQKMELEKRLSDKHSANSKELELRKKEMEKQSEMLNLKREAMERQVMAERELREKAISQQKREMEMQHKAMQKHQEAMQLQHEKMERQKEELEKKQRQSNKFVDLLTSELLADGLIKNKNKFKFQISKEKLLVNKKKQNAVLHKKYLGLYQEYHNTKFDDNAEVTIQKN